ncbi:hypothetical protein L345_09711, partial [Ophiophagus hannah]
SFQLDSLRLPSCITNSISKCFLAPDLIWNLEKYKPKIRGCMSSRWTLQGRYRPKSNWFFRRMWHFLSHLTRTSPTAFSWNVLPASLRILNSIQYGVKTLMSMDGRYQVASEGSHNCLKVLEALYCKACELTIPKEDQIHNLLLNLAKC